MITTVSIIGNVPAIISKQIRAMGAEYSDELAMDAFPKSSPLNIVGRAMMSLELGAYMAAMGRDPVQQAGLIVALDDAKPDVVFGFILYAPLSGEPGHCGIIYTAVSVELRRRGILRQMLVKLSERMRQSTLSSQISLVPMYERLGFHVIGHRDSQIVMTNGQTPSAGKMRLMNSDMALEHPDVLQANTEMLQRFGHEQIHKSLVAHTQDMDLKRVLAKDFAEAMLSKQARQALINL